ncbi:MAG: catalase, partial [Pyrinomonadaceae bacterium]|nr:catalase [Phycisphaerales bacterium]
ELSVQVVKPADLDKFAFNPLDATKIWPEKLVPSVKIGKMTLNRTPDTANAEGAGAPEKPPGDAPAEKKKDAKPDHGKRWAESILFDVRALIQVEGQDVRGPLPSPDGKKLLYIRGRGEMVLLNLGDRTEKTLLSGWDEPDVIWAGDSRHLMYAVSNLDYNSDIWLMDIETDKPADAAINLTRHPDTDASPRLSADGKVLTYLSERAGENGEFDVWQVYLDKKLEGMKSYELDDYFKKAAEAAAKARPLDAPADPKPKTSGEAKAAESKPDPAGASAAEAAPKPADRPDVAGDTKARPREPMEFDADDAYLRARRLTSYPGSEGELQMTPGGDRVILLATIDNERALISLDRKGEDRKVISPGPASNVSISLTGDKAIFAKAGVVNSAPAKGAGKVEPVIIDAPITVDVARQQRQKFLEAARILGTRFYHNTLKGLDWDALTERYLSLAIRTSTPEEFNRVVGALFGELNGSHTGISGGGVLPVPGLRPGVGMLGVNTEPVGNGYRVTTILQGSPADQRSSKLEVGDVIVGIDGTLMLDWGSNAGGKGVVPPVMPDLSQLLLGKAGKETLLEVERVDTSKPRLVLIVPITSGAMNELGYQAEMKRRRELVDQLSGGQLGYLHIRSMNDASVHDFERDLFAAGDQKAGLIIDVRDNGGGYTTDILLASLTAPVHAKTQPRGVDPATIPSDAYPRDRRLIYAYTRPINVLINENSFSNAEVFAHAIKTIKRGTLVGTRTFGGVISTGGTTLIDGTTVRVPNRGWWLPDGKEMENNGAMPDVEVRQLPEDDVAGRDMQIEAAVKELMGRVGAK